MRENIARGGKRSRQRSGQPAPGSTSKPSRTRTFTGCIACRDRHLKCDEAKPKCSLCQRLKIECQGSAPSLLWINTDWKLDTPTPDHRARHSAYRFPLYKEDIREEHTKELVQSLGDDSADNAVADLDLKSVAGHDLELHTLGPFGVFRAFTNPEDLIQNGSPETSVLPEAFESLEPDNTLSLIQNECAPRDLPDTWPSQCDTMQPFPSLLEGSHTQMLNDMAGDLHSASLAGDIYNWMQDELRFFDPGLGALPFNSADANETDQYFKDAASSSLPVDDTTFELALHTSSAYEQDEDSSMHPHADTSPEQTTGILTRTTNAIPPSISACSNPNRGGILPLHGDKLLRYLKEQVLGGCTESLFSSRMSPWKELLLPCGLETYAEISLWNHSSHTRLTILYTLLAKSAYHLHRSSSKKELPDSRWYNVALKHRHDAQKHLQEALARELDGSNRAKYTELLMAILGMGFVSLYFEGPKLVRKILSDAERLIRCRGIPAASKSNRVRLLHHMYTHLRVIMESTRMSPMQPSQGRNSPGLLTSCQTIPNEMVGNNFRTSEASLCQLDYRAEKPDEVGYNDIHLEVSGSWCLTMYPDMYGIPESLMTLHSQTIGLVNEKPKLEMEAFGNPELAVSLQTHIKTLEQQIWSWSKMPAGPERPRSLITTETSPFERQDSKPLINAIHQALIIYFYRRVYNINAMMMQDTVLKTLDLIQPYLEVDRYDQDFALTIGWVLFIAACEAVTPALQDRSMRCLETIDDCGVFVETSTPSATAKSIWEERARLDDFTYSWPDLMSLRA